MIPFLDWIELDSSWQLESNPTRMGKHDGFGAHVCVCGLIWPIPGALKSWRPRRRWWYQPQRPAMPSGWSKNGQRGAKNGPKWPKNVTTSGGRFAPNQQLPGPLTHVSRAPMMSTDGTSRGFMVLSPRVSGVGPFLQNIAENSNFATSAGITC